MIKLKQSQVKAYRDEMLMEQDGKCAYCGQDCKKPCLDHAHMEPYKDKIRGVICNWCNIAIGKLENARVRTGTDWQSFYHSFPEVYNYVHGDEDIGTWGEHGYRSNDWHPSKRKSEVTAFRKMNAESQLSSLASLLVKFESTLTNERYPTNATERIKLFRKLNNKT